ncbi:MAG: hypothetical protein IJ689_06280, partial [Alphaproteobacteria bacterium]|nr:hypothetical protein [Alphaproteobacteria bacterium]
MTVTATIAHDVSLSVDHDLNMGTVTVNPGADWSEGGNFGINSDGTILLKTGNIISVTGVSIGTFTANVPDSCKVDGIATSNTGSDHPCFRTSGSIALGNSTAYEPDIVYDSGNKFKFYYFSVSWDDGVIPQSGTFTEDIEIEYIL